VPESYKQGSLALGATKWQTIRKVVLPSALPGITTGVMLSTGRIIGETAVFLLTTGSVLRLPLSPFDPCRPMTVHALFGGAHDISVLDAGARRKAVATATSAIELAVELGAPMVVMHASAEPITPEQRGRRLETARESLAELGRTAAASGRRIAVELLPRTCIGNTVEELLVLLEGIPRETFGVCLDVNHGMDRWRSLPEDIRRLGDRLITTHLSDYDGIDERHWLPGRGITNWTSVIANLAAGGYRGPFMFEVTHKNAESPVTPADLVRCWQQLLQQATA
jgi:sugar phosphate isomerase/epimerase